MADGRSCADVDECATGVSGCSHLCVNLLGSYACQCPRGYEMNEDQRTCVDVDECKKGGGGGPCDGRCHNTNGAFFCSCPPGYGLDPVTGVRCIDRNECLQGVLPDRRPACHPTSQQCTNLPGSFQCSCKGGYEQTTQPPHNTQTQPLHNIQTQQQTQQLRQLQLRMAKWSSALFAPARLPAAARTMPPSFTSLQLAEVSGGGGGAGATIVGFAADLSVSAAGEVAAESDFSWLVCRDVNACELSPLMHREGRLSVCPSPRSVCANTPGSYRCDCPAGQIYSGLTDDCRSAEVAKLSPPPVSLPLGGRWGREEKERQEGCGRCSSSAEECLFGGGAWTCSCRRGYRAVVGGGCADIDECKESSSTCREASRPCCVNWPGGFDCVAKEKRPWGALAIGWRACPA
eukprot:GHVS01048887.1.p1 GENE.GHVS01048887.1~~GHVS01048887.1.p1  ORF type:complete len:415 (-),score=80.27 GHVS01048887.1:446-1654(-)